MGGLVIISSEARRGPCDLHVPVVPSYCSGWVWGNSSTPVRFVPISRAQAGFQPSRGELSTGCFGAGATSLTVCHRAEGTARR